MFQQGKKLGSHAGRVAGSLIAFLFAFGSFLYAVSVQKDTLAKLIVVSEMNGVELEELIHTILEKGIEEHGFYE